MCDLVSTPPRHHTAARLKYLGRKSELRLGLGLGAEESPRVEKLKSWVRSAISLLEVLRDNEAIALPDLETVNRVIRRGNEALREGA